MLHCPSCSNAEMQQHLQQHQQPQQRQPQGCPAGDRCPHQRLQPQQPKVNYLSGGGILFEQQQQQQQLHQPKPSLMYPLLVFSATGEPMFRVTTSATTTSTTTGCNFGFCCCVSANACCQHHHHQQQQQLQFQTQKFSTLPGFTFLQPSLPLHPAPLPVSSIQEILSSNRQKLQECLWYYPLLSCSESSTLLEKTSPGTFLVRDSSDPRFLYSLSVQRSMEEGPTSVRIHFARGKFRLDAEENIRDLMPEFDSVPALVDHYLMSDVAKDGNGSVPAAFGKDTMLPVWVDEMGKTSSPISLRKPLFRSVPTLRHLARLTTAATLLECGNMKRTDQLGLPVQLARYLHDYPHRA